MGNALRGRRRHRRRHRSRENEARRGGADRVADHRIGGDIAPDDAEAFGQCTFDDVDPVHDPVALGNAGAASPVKTDGVDLIEIGQGSIFVRQVADPANRSDVAIHRIQRFKGNKLRTAGLCLAQQLFEMC